MGTDVVMQRALDMAQLQLSNYKSIVFPMSKASSASTNVVRSGKTASQKPQEQTRTKK